MKKNVKKNALNLTESMIAVSVGIKSLSGKSSVLDSDYARSKNAVVSRVKINALILDSQSLRKITTLRVRVSQFFSRYPSLGGFAIIPKSMKDACAAQVAQWKTEFDNILEEFENEYPTLISAAKKQLGELYDKAMIPSYERCKNSFGFEPCYLDITVTDQNTVGLVEKKYAETIKNIVNDIGEKLAGIADGRKVKASVLESIKTRAAEIKAYGDTLGLSGDTADTLVNTIETALKENEVSEKQEAIKELVEQLGEEVSVLDEYYGLL